jgi:transcriptional regulator with XRE-family HTH domain
MAQNELTIGEYVRGLRRKKGWNLQMLAEKTELSYHHLSRIENDSATPGAETLTALAEALGGSLKLMLELVGSVPSAIVSRMGDRPGSPALRRAAGDRPRAGTESPRGVAVALARSMGVPASEADELASAMLRLLQLERPRRSVIVDLIKTLSKGRHGER